MGGFFFPLCLFLIPHNKFLLSVPKFSLLHLGDRDGLHYVCSLPIPLVSSCLTWLIRAGGGRLDGGVELLLVCVALLFADGSAILDG